MSSDTETGQRVTTQQISDVHEHLVRLTGEGIDPAIVRQAMENAGFIWDRENDEPETDGVTLTIPVRTLFARGLFMKYCDVTGMSEWAVNEGQLDMDDTVTVSMFDAHLIGII